MWLPGSAEQMTADTQVGKQTKPGLLKKKVT